MTTTTNNMKLRVSKSLASVIEVDLVDGFDPEIDEPMLPIVAAWTGTAIAAPINESERDALRLAFNELSNLQDDISLDKNIPECERAVARAAVKSIESIMTKLRNAI